MNHLGVGAVAYHTVSHGKSPHSRTHFDYPARIAITQGQRFIEFEQHCLQRRQQSIRLDLVDHLPHFFRLLPRLGYHSRAAEFHKHPFRARGDHRGPRLDQQMAR